MTTRNILTSLVAAAFLITSNTAYSEWDPHYLISQSLLSGEHLNDLNNHKFIKLKKSVTEFLENTWCSKEKAELIMDLIVLEKLKNCVEIGVFTGSSFLPITSTLKYLHRGKAYAIDPWSNQEAIRNLDDWDPNKNWWKEVDMKLVQDTFKQMIRKWDLKSYCTILKETSERVVHKVGQIDFLHIDGNYTHDTVLADAINYLPKVKLGGYILMSNLFFSVNGDQPKMDAFFYLADSCEIISEIDSNNTVLLKKVSEASDQDE